MDADSIIDVLGTLKLADLRRIDQAVHEWIGRIEAGQQPVDETKAPKKTYRQEYVKCGKARCKKCSDGGAHGPYWFAYWSEGRRTRKQYIRPYHDL
jgi:hypothetical protein